MRITSFKPYSNNTANVNKRAHAIQTRNDVFAEQRQIAVVHQAIGSNNIKCTSSQLDTVNRPIFAKVSAPYKPAFKIRKKGQNTHTSGTEPLQAENKYLLNTGWCKFSPRIGELNNKTTSNAITIISNSSGLAKPIRAKNKGNE